MGTVYRGYDTVLERQVAIKVLSRSWLDNEGRGKLISEAQTAAKLNHPNIVTIYDAGEDGTTPFIVMEYMEGKSLHEERPELLEETLEILGQVCAGLEHAHRQGIIPLLYGRLHLLVKPWVKKISLSAINPPFWKCIILEAH